MSPSIRDRIIIATADLPKKNIARDLEQPVNHDEHNIIHVLYGLNRSGLVAFQSKKKGQMQTIYNVRLTKQGEKYRETLE